MNGDGSVSVKDLVEDHVRRYHPEVFAAFDAVWL